MKRVFVKKTSVGPIDLGSAASSSGSAKKRVHLRKEVIERKRSSLQRQGMASLEVRREHALKNSRLGTHTIETWLLSVNVAVSHSWRQRVLWLEFV